MAKRDHLVTSWRDAGLAMDAIEHAQMLGIAADALRDRVDLSLRRRADGATVLGLDDVEHTGVVDIRHCPALTPALQEWVHDFRDRLPVVDSAAVRLRVAPDGTRGVWLDCRNSDIARLVAESDQLRELSRFAVVELGQRHATIDWGDASPRLIAHVLRPWFETYVGDEQRPTPLFGTIGGFTQPGFAANRALVAAVRAAVRSTGARTVLELGAGSGNFTLPLAYDGLDVAAVELDRRALDGLRASLHCASLQNAGLGGLVTVDRGNLQRLDDTLLECLGAADLVLADPPRAGLQRVVDALLELTERPRFIVYVSCLVATLVADARALIDGGYRLVAATGVDLFPQSPHGEWIMTFERGR